MVGICTFEYHFFSISASKSIAIFVYSIITDNALWIIDVAFVFAYSVSLQNTERR